MTYHWEKHNPYAQKRKRNVPTSVTREVNGRIVRMYPDNDGGFWYFVPGTMEEVHIR